MRIHVFGLTAVFETTKFHGENEIKDTLNTWDDPLQVGDYEVKVV